ncbi:MAG: trypsin-like peptidase domain-containing protein [Gemmataceae bacterium]|jgi:S1-C subfamily serine protease|nr:trypsin-like peptidase domain-containing protein [Gemmataceae bacterium]
MKFPWFLLLAIPSLGYAQLSPEILALQKSIHSTIERAEPSIVCIGISRSEEYAELGEVPTPATPGKLGGFNPLRHRRFGDLIRQESINRLDLARPETVPESYGSGVVIDSAGLILTNAHLIEKAVKIYVRFANGKGSYADIHASDSRSDLAVLRLIDPFAGIKAINLGDGGAVRKGDLVICMANPFNAGFRDGSPSASWGIISNLKRRIVAPVTEERRAKPLNQYGTLIQTDIRLNIACSGGALLNLKGELIGLTTATAAVTGGETAAGYAIPIDRNIKRIIERLSEGQEVDYGFLGVSFRQDDRDRLLKGVLIDSVPAGFPADRAGLRIGDILLKVDNQEINSQEDLFLHVGAALAGNEIAIEYRRGQNILRTKATLVKLSNNEPFIASQLPSSVHGIRVDYSSIFGTDVPPEGVAIKMIDRGSLAAKALPDWQKTSRYVILSVNRKPVNSPAEFYAACEKSPISLEIREHGKRGAGTIITLPE